MVRLIIIIVTLLVLAGGAFSGLVAFRVVPDYLGLGIALEEPPPPPPPPPVRPDYVDIEPFLLPVILEDGTLERRLYIDLRLEVKPGSGSEVRQHMPVLHDAFVRYLHQWIPMWRRDNPDIDLTVMKQRLKEVADRVVGSGRVQAVLLQGIFDQ